MNRKERDRLQRLEKLKRLKSGLYTLLLNICFFVFIIVVVLGFMYL